MEEIKLVVFDLAGTVIEDSGQVPAAFTAAACRAAHFVRSISLISAITELQKAA
jgi:hypothetical protein